MPEEKTKEEVKEDEIDEYLAEDKDVVKTPPPPAKVEAKPKAIDPTEILMTEMLKVQGRAIIRGSALDALAESEEIAPAIFDAACRANDARMVKEMCIVFGVSTEEFYAAYALIDEDEEDEDEEGEEEEEEEVEEAPAPPAPSPKVVAKKKRISLDEEFVK